MLNRFFVGILLLAATSLSTIAASLPPRLIESINGEIPIRLSSLKITGDISGGMAETTVQMVFFNPNDRALEGNLQFPLLDGQQIIAFSLDIEGKLRQAVPVEKARGRQTFEDVSRRKIDPALLEATQGNNFKLRIFPIPAKGTRTVELKYVEKLIRVSEHWSYRLPLTYGDRLQDFDLDLKVQGSKTVPTASGAMSAIGFSRNGDNYQAHITKNKFTPTGTLNIQIPASVVPQSYTQERDDATYFVTEIPISTKREFRKPPKIVGLLWDSSSSAADHPHHLEFAELDRYFKALRNVEVRLTVLRNRAEPAASFNITDGNWEKLRATLESTVYDGASALGDWQPQSDVIDYLLVSDGLINYGPREFPHLADGQRLYTLNSSLIADNNKLAALAEQSGGRLIPIVAGKPGVVAEALLTETPTISNLRSDNAADLMVDSIDIKQGILRIAGKLNARTAQLTFKLLQAGQTKESTVLVSTGGSQHMLASYLWASYKLRSLEANYETHRAEIRRIGLAFGIPTKETSLIVLDRLEDYVRYEIPPPTPLVAAYQEFVRFRGEQLKQKRTYHLDRVVKEFSEKIVWWEKSYPKDAPPKPVVVKVSDSERAASPALSGSPPPPAPVMAMAPPMNQSAMTNTVDARQVQEPSQRAKSSHDKPSNEVGIAIKQWTSDAPYMARLSTAPADTVYAAYLDEKPSYINSSGFYLDVADILLNKGQRDLALRVLSNLAEMDLESRNLLRILGYRLLQAGAPELAIPIFEKVQKIAEEEPQSFRDLGLAHAAAGHYQQAIDQLNEVVIRPWDDRFAEIELITLAELNAIVVEAAKQNETLDISRIDPRLIKNMPLDLRAVLTWDADNSDMDLWVTDPNEEKCYYAHRFTRQGGRLSRDFTGGYGPEEFSLRDAKPGKYKIEANFFGNGQQVIANATTLQVRLTSDFGKENAKDQMITLRLKGRGETVLVGEFEVKAK